MNLFFVLIVMLISGDNIGFRTITPLFTTNFNLIIYIFNNQSHIFVSKKTNYIGLKLLNWYLFDFA